MKEEVQIKRLGSHDIIIFQKLIGLFQDVFEMENLVEAQEPYLPGLLQKPDFIALCAIVENEIVGGLTAYELPLYYNGGSEIFIYDLAVKPAFQRKGFGRKLLVSLEEYCQQSGIRVMFVSANEEDEHAVDFYHSTGGKAEKVIHFNYFFGK
jgi:aminoglycoside 3-N-acetyltransferase I